jgi:hypothetical protein
MIVEYSERRIVKKLNSAITEEESWRIETKRCRMHYRG